MFDQILCLATAGDQNEILGDFGRRLPVIPKPMNALSSRLTGL